VRLDGVTETSGPLVCKRRRATANNNAHGSPSAEVLGRAVARIATEDPLPTRGIFAGRLRQGVRHLKAELRMRGLQFILHPASHSTNSIQVRLGCVAEYKFPRPALVQILLDLDYY